MRTLLRSRAGLSLLEVMIAGAIGMIFLASTLRQLEFVDQSTRDIRTKLELSNLQALMMQALSSGSCSGSFLGVPDAELSQASFAQDLSSPSAIDALSLQWLELRKQGTTPSVQALQFQGATFIKLQDHPGTVATLERVLARGTPIAHVGALISAKSVVEKILLERQTNTDGSRVSAVLRSDGTISVPMSLTLVSGVARRSIPFIMDVSGAGVISNCTLSTMGEDPLERQCNELRGQWIDHPLLAGDEKICTNFYKQEARFIVSSTYNVANGIVPALPTAVGWIWQASLKRSFQSASTSNPGSMSDWYLNIFREANAPNGVLLYDQSSETLSCNSALGWSGKFVIPNFTSSSATSAIAMSGFGSGSGFALGTLIPFAYSQRVQLSSQTQSRSYAAGWETVTYNDGTSSQRCICATWAADSSGNAIIYKGVPQCQTCQTITQNFPEYLNPGIAGADRVVPQVTFGSASSGTHPTPAPLGGPPPAPVTSLISCVKDI